MAKRTQASNPADLGEGTLIELFFQVVDRIPDHPALKHYGSGNWPGRSYAEVLEEVRAVAAALVDLGLERGDRAAILSSNRPEWAIADWGCLCAGVVDVPIYASLMPEQVAYILGNSGARLIFCQDREQLDKVLEVRGDLPDLKHVVVFDRPGGELPDGVTSWADFTARGGAIAREEAAADFRARALSVGPGDTATILYTSGTTGDPKGVMLSHNNLSSNVRAARQILRIDETDSTLSFLPLSHVFQRMVDYLLFSQGCCISYARSMDTVADDLKLVKPTVVVSVPRLYEKVYARVMEADGAKGALVQWAAGVGEKWADAQLQGRKPSAPVALQYGLAKRLVFGKIKEAVGGRLRYFVSGGAPLAPDINRFFFSSGVMILEGYGLTETSPVTNVNSPRDFPDGFRIGTVGRPVPGTEIRIADDGEILVRGPQVMKGYYNLPEATREAIDDDGWFKTGDVGELDEDGFLTITDRKKDIIVTAGGKNVAPQPIENRLKKNRFVDQPVLVGDDERFITLILVPDFDVLEGWAKQEGVAVDSRRALLDDERTQKLLFGVMEKELGGLSNFEMPKKLVLLGEPFTIEDGTLTPTQKVKRRIVQKRLRDLLDRVYDEDEPRERTVYVAVGVAGSDPDDD
ncbi:MAG: long-chain fatty acid--CoA ligase [Gemmatimonadales bacterium]|nr:MAG: long-chain fatty acid--CoA ligase [Gemmatimonadales bacterium]